MPLDLHGVAATFQCLIAKVLASHQGYTAAYYTDNVVVYSGTWEEHL